MVIQTFDFDLRRADQPVYRGETTFGFFTRDALAQQVGLRDAPAFPIGRAPVESFVYPDEEWLPDKQWRMIDRVEALVENGGPHGLGLVVGSKQVRPEEWFFKAHFYQDPVMPGSLGLESLIQLMKLAACKRWGAGRFAVMQNGPHTWQYRGQVIPTNGTVTVTAIITGRDDVAKYLSADGFLAVDGRTIYKMADFTLRHLGN
jgi:3-hydroxymyristoyl/3-hydroxydecanoyl-(acyl carrier protein) dehydratase